ncbi:MAG TPA: YggS family pyridoxal phosphate-dependent enzyme [Opitutaceae bacterium]|nr:YggS family pyridoxal phosphate-dependent enzyme [Opitutaceae bacterium]
MITYDDFRLRADAVLRRIGEACARAGRNPAEVRLLAVTKTHPPEAAGYAARYGLAAVGENRVQEGAEKRGQCAAAIRWELIGHLQSNKAALAARTFDRIQSVDTAKLAEQLDRAAAAAGKVLPILLQINAADDPAKFGAAPDAAAALLEAALARPALRVEGLMTIARLSPDPAVAQRCFAGLRELRDRLAPQFAIPLAELSMGMSGDLEAAVAAGSTLVRVGSALFGERA